MKNSRKKDNFLYKQELRQIILFGNFDKEEDIVVEIVVNACLFFEAFETFEQLLDKLNPRPKVNQTECIAFRNQFVDAFAEEAKVK